jgi:SAM-dependent methyltransferase
MKVKNLKIVGCDNSFPMLKMAQANLKNRKPLLINQDARHPAIREKSFDAAVMLYDSINYFFSEKEISILFTEIKYLLKDNGIFIFDFITQAGLKDCYKDYYESDSWDGLAYERHSWFSFADSIQHNEFIFLYNGKSYREVHKQKVRSVDEWATLVKKSDMKLISKFSNFTFQPASEKSERVHFICRII